MAIDDNIAHAVRRIDMFSDGVFAIAITLLVLELPFDKVRSGQLAHTLGHHWPDFAAYVISFAGIGIAWMQHHAVFDAIARIDRRIVLLNLLLLMTIAFLPFPTGLVGQYIREGDNARVAALAFSGTWTVSTVLVTWLWTYVVHRPEMLVRGVRPDAARRLLRFQVGAVAAYLVFTALAFVSPIATMAGYALAAVVFLVGSDFRALGVEPEGARAETSGGSR